MYIDEVENYLLKYAQRIDNSIKTLLFTSNNHGKTVLIVILRDGKEDLHCEMDLYESKDELITSYENLIKDTLLNTLPYMDRKVRMMNL